MLHDGRHAEQQKPTANDGAMFDSFGDAVALSGDTLVVGARSDDVGANVNQGSAHAHTQSGDAAGRLARHSLQPNADGCGRPGALSFGGLWLYFLGWLMLLLCTCHIDHFDLFGLRQVWLYLRGREYAPIKFRTPGLYRHVRHPIYSGFQMSVQDELG